MNIAVIGCDTRYYYLCKKLSEYGHTLKLCGVNPTESNKNITACDFNEIYNCNALILPIPVSRDKINLNAPCFSEQIELKSIFSNISPDTTVFGGGEYSHRQYINYCDENFVNKNSILTAEGALYVAMQNKRSCLFGAKCLVVGFGHLGKAVCKAFKNIGCKVTATARKKADFEDMVIMGYTVAHTGNIANIIGEYDIVINTVPHQVIDAGALQYANEDSLFLELASPPYGIDFNAAESRKLNAINLPALPAKYAPISAGELIAESVQNLILKKENRR